MSPQMKKLYAKVKQREARRQALDSLIMTGTADERSDARKTRKVLAQSWDKREQQPGNFHRPPRKDGTQRFVMK